MVKQGKLKAAAVIIGLVVLAGCGGIFEPVERLNPKDPESPVFLEAPAAPELVSVLPASDTSVTATWQDNSDTEDGFVLERREGLDGEWVEAVTTAANVTEYTDTGLTPATGYFYRLYAFNDAGSSDTTEEEGTATLSGPAAPTDPSADAVSDTEITVGWTDNSDNETSFEVWRKEGAGGEWALAGTAAEDAASYGDSGLSQNTLYFYRVRAANDWGESAYTDEVSAETEGIPADPTGLNVTIISANEIGLSWSYTGDSQDGFRIYYKVGAGAYVDQGSAPTIAASPYRHTFLESNTAYTYYVVAYNGYGESGPTAEEAGTTEDWTITTLDSSGITGYWPSVCIDSAGYPHVSYSHKNYDELWYIYENASGWQTPVDVDTSGEFMGKTSLALDSADNPHILYYDSYNHNIRHAWNDGSWNKENVESASYGIAIAIAVDSSDNPHAAYAPGAMVYNHHNGSSWVGPVSPDNTTTSSSGRTGIAIDSSDYPRISYYDGTNGYLKYAAWNGSSWTTETVDDTADVGKYNSLALDSNQYPHISYYDETSDDLKYARWDGSDWQVETVYSAGSVGRYNDIVLDSNDRPHIAFDYDSEDNIMYAHYNGSDWIVQGVDSSGAAWGHPSIAITDDDRPVIAYYCGEGAVLKFAEKP